jgi:hypothetical protein
MSFRLEAMLPKSTGLGYVRPSGSQFLGHQFHHMDTLWGIMQNLDQASKQDRRFETKLRLVVAVLGICPIFPEACGFLSSSY